MWESPGISCGCTGMAGSSNATGFVDGSSCEGAARVGSSVNSRGSAGKAEKRFLSVLIASTAVLASASSRARAARWWRMKRKRRTAKMREPPMMPPAMPAFAAVVRPALLGSSAYFRVNSWALMTLTLREALVTTLEAVGAGMRGRDGVVKQGVWPAKAEV